MEKIFAGFGDPPQLGPIVAHEVTEDGWRGLTEEGEILSANGSVPEGEVLIVRGGKVLGYRKVEQRFAIQDYDAHFRRAAALSRSNRDEEALVEVNLAMRLAPTIYARFNRCFMLLALGRWDEGLSEYEICERGRPFQRPRMREALEAGVQPWRGEDLSGKRLLLVHDHGFGDTIQMLRYVPTLRAMGAEVSMRLPDELARLAEPLGCPCEPPFDYVCSFLHLLRWLRVTPGSVTGEPYVKVDPTLRDKWAERLGASERPRVGLAWDVGVIYPDDYPRVVPLDLLQSQFDPEVDLYSVQAQGADGVHSFKFEDFADCAALMSLMDEIVSVDTAALHLAGAIGHPRVTGLLSYWHSWRWLARWYDSVKLCTQRVPDDWSSALEQIR
jgi:hypothetical protein